MNSRFKLIILLLACIFILAETLFVHHLNNQMKEMHKSMDEITASLDASEQTINNIIKALPEIEKKKQVVVENPLPQTKETVCSYPVSNIAEIVEPVDTPTHDITEVTKLIDIQVTCK